MRAPTASSAYDIVALRLDEIPDDEPLLQRQRFEHVRDVGRMHGVELRAKFGDVLPVHQRFHQLVLWHFLAFHQALDQAVPPKELLNLTQVGLQVLEFLLRAEGFDHARRPFAVKLVRGLPRATPYAPHAAAAILAAGCMMAIEKSRPMAPHRAALGEDVRPAKTGNMRAILPRMVPASVNACFG